MLENTIRPFKMHDISSRTLKLFYLTVLISCLILLFQYFSISFRLVPLTCNVIPFVTNTSEQYNNESITCKVPEFDPFDPRVKSLYENLGKYKCEEKESFLKRNSRNTISINTTILTELYNTTLNSINCTCASIERKSDDDWQYGEWHTLEFDSPLEEEFLMIECDNNGTSILKELFCLFPDHIIDNLKEKNPKDVVNNHPPKMNVLILGVDSISRLNSIRHLTKTRSILNQMNALEFTLYNKVGENTYPNMLALLTGHHHQHFDSLIYYDDLDFLWRHYSQKGYKTLYQEDWPQYGPFNSYGCKGFKKSPVDFYFRPMSIALDKFQSGYCMRNQLKVEFAWDYIKFFIETISNYKPYFIFSFIAEISHNYINYAGYVDEGWATLLTELYKNKHLENTFLMIFSDHGLRYGDIRNTILGHYEANMPMGFLIPPPWFEGTFPRLYRHLQQNTNKLVTLFDFRETFLHILNLPEEEKYIEPRRSYGISLLNKIPSSRSCEDAGIPDSFCSCFNYSDTKTSPEIIEQAANFAVGNINEILKPASDLCHNLTLDKVMQSKSNKAEEDLELILLVIQTTPGNAVFEATVYYKNETKEFGLVNEIVRTNSYKDDSKCVKQTKLVNFCYCKSID